jgi:CRP-like cAMP-binding protein
LLWLIQNHGLENDNKTIRIDLSRDDLARLVATNTETLIRTLKEFQKDEVIELRRRKISIADIQHLNHIASA